MEDVDWLRSMLSMEQEVRPPGSKKSETKFLNGNCVKLYDEERIVAYAEMRKVGSHVEISTVLVDPEYRNKGYGKRLIEQAVKKKLTTIRFFVVQKSGNGRSAPFS